jgi:peptidoglycan hydrolase-like protein with peptidoglycan-binding domain
MPVQEGISVSTQSYAVAGLVLSPSQVFSSQVQDLQRDLRSLGYGKGPIDGMFGPGTANAVKALQFDLMNNDGSSSQGDGAAPVAVKNYNNGSVTALTGVVDQGLVACIAAMLADAAFPSLPSSSNPAADNQSAIAAVKSLSPAQVPIPFLMAILMQESDCMHFQVPGGANSDNYVTIGLDRNNAANPAAITSRGYGIGQYTLFHHPPTADEVAQVIKDPAKNVQQAVSELRGKFDNFVNGATPNSQADDRIAEVGAGALRVCQYQASDARYLTDCANCLASATLTNITAGVTPVYAGSQLTYGQTQYHIGSYQNVPVRANIPCDWPYAVRRYNGGGVNSYDYQAEVLLRVVKSA